MSFRVMRIALDDSTVKPKCSPPKPSEHCRHLDLEEANNATFLVLELVEGETPADRIARGPIPVDEAMNIAKAICEALEAAHENLGRTLIPVAGPIEWYGIQA